MRRKRVHLWALNGLDQVRALGSVTLCYVLGSVAGSWSSALLEQEGTTALRGWLEGYLTLTTQQALSVRLPGVLWQTLRLPLLLTLLQFTVLGMLFIPLVMGIRGFLLSFAVTGFVRTYTWRGLAAAAVLFLPLNAVELSALFLLATAAFLRADRMGREGAQKGGSSGGVAALCWGVLTLCAAAELLLSGPLKRGLTLILQG